MHRWVTAWRTERITLSSPAPPDALLRHLRAGIDARHRRRVPQALFADAEFVIIGRADDRGMAITAARPHVGNDFRTHLIGHITPDGSGSRLHGHFGVRLRYRLLAAVLLLTAAGSWLAVTILAIGSLHSRGLTWQAPVVMLVITAFCLAFPALLELCLRLAAPEADHLRGWLTARLATVPRSPAPHRPASRPPAAPDGGFRIRPPHP
ncbi:hypothetical protein [Actinoplanes utahensis]|uniref:hypothetical protein n=1 Tax=Actinoplanes utahensis TaxID=1869 RepID=UPI000AD7146B|nr:hypothetical protein [Actinoplanes utahensis]